MTQEILSYLQNYFIAFLFLLERFILLFFFLPSFYHSLFANKS